MKTPSLLLAFTLLATAASAQTLTESYEARSWQAAVGLPAAVVSGFSSAQAIQGTQSLAVLYDAAQTPDFGIVDSREFPPESETPLTTGFSVMVYAEPIGGATGAPQVKLALWSVSNSEMGGGDVALTANAWTTVTLPNTNVIEEYKFVRFVIGNNGSTGQFNLYFDDMQRDGVLYDPFEQGISSLVQLVNTEGTAAGGPVAVEHLLNDPVAGGPTDGALAFAATWTGDTNNTVEIEHNFATPLDLTAYDTVTLDAYFPTGTTLPTNVFAFFWDGSAGYGSDTSVTPTSNDAWESISLDISGITGASGFNEANVTQLKIVLPSVDAAGTAYIDNLQILPITAGVDDWMTYR